MQYNFVILRTIWNHQRRKYLILYWALLLKTEPQMQISVNVRTSVQALLTELTGFGEIEFIG